MSETSTPRRKVVVNRSMSLDGFIAGPGHTMDWGPMARFVPRETVASVAAETGSMLIGRRTWDVGDRMEADEPGSTDYPFTGPFFLLTHRPLERPDPDVTILSGDVGKAVATALDARVARTWSSSAPMSRASAWREGSSTRSWCTSCRSCSATELPSRLRGSPGSPSSR